MADLLPAMARQDVETSVLAHEHRPSATVTPEGEVVSGVRVFRAPTHGQLLYAPISPAFPVWLRRIIRRLTPDILHLHMPNTSAFWVLGLADARRIPWVVHWHSDVVASQHDRRLAAAYRFYRPFEQLLLSRSEAIIATSPPYLESSAALAPWREKCEIVPLGLDENRLPQPTATDLEDAERQWGDALGRVLTIGRMTYYKGHEYLIQAAARVAGLKIILVGDGEHRPSLEQLVAQLGLEDRVLLPGRQSESRLSALMASCNCLCLPSIERTEAFGLVLLEAMSREKPVVASNVPGSGMGWVVEAGRTGLLVPPANPDELAAALRQLTENSAMQIRMGLAGRQRFQDQFSIDAVATRLLSLYRKLV